MGLVGLPTFIPIVVSDRYLLQHGCKMAANASGSQHTYAYTVRLLVTLTRYTYISEQLHVLSARCLSLSG